MNIYLEEWRNGGLTFGYRMRRETRAKSPGGFLLTLDPGDKYLVPALLWSAMKGHMGRRL